MAQEKVSFEKFLEAVEAENRGFILDLDEFMVSNGCKATIEEKKNGFLASYKHVKLKRSIINVLFRKAGMLVRIYGENAHNYLEFMNGLPKEMVESISGSGDCGRLVNNTCSTKCSGYDVTIGGERYQKCRYNAFEFLVTEESKPFIKLFIENELRERVK